jgi:hypothetical protein
MLVIERKENKYFGRRNWIKIIVIAIIVIGVLWGSLSGFTKEGTLNILLEDQKFGRRALLKAKLHGNSMVPILLEHADKLKTLSGYNKYLIIDLFENINGQKATIITDDLIKDNNLTNKLFGLALLVNINKSKILTAQITLVNDIICRRHPKLISNTLEMQEDIWLSLYIHSKYGDGNIDCIRDIAEDVHKVYSPRVRKIAKSLIDNANQGVR